MRPADNVGATYVATAVTTPLDAATVAVASSTVAAAATQAHNSFGAAASFTDAHTAAIAAQVREVMKLATGDGGEIVCVRKMPDSQTQTACSTTTAPPTAAATKNTAPVSAVETTGLPNVTTAVTAVTAGTRVACVQPTKRELNVTGGRDDVQTAIPNASHSIRLDDDEVFLNAAMPQVPGSKCQRQKQPVSTDVLLCVCF